MGRYGAYAPHTIEYQIYRGEATDSSAAGYSKQALCVLGLNARLSDRIKTPFSAMVVVSQPARQPCSYGSLPLLPRGSVLFPCDLLHASVARF